MKTKNISFTLGTNNTEKKEDGILDHAIAKTSQKEENNPSPYPYSLVGEIVEVYNNGLAQVTFYLEERSYTYEALSTQALKRDDEEKSCLLTFNNGKLSSPIITGLIQSQISEPLKLSSSEGIILECGKSRIVLDPEGILDLKARHINAQAYGPFRIKGASVKLN